MIKWEKPEKQKELNGLGLLQGFAIIVFVVLVLMRVDTLVKNNALDLFLVSFLFMFMFSVTPRITGIEPGYRFSPAKKYVRKEKPDSLIRIFLISLLVGIIFGVIGLLLPNG